MHESIAAELAPDGTYEPDNSVPRWLLVEPATTAASPTSIGATIGAADGRLTGGCRELGVGSVAHRADHRDANDGGGDDDDELFGLEKRIRDEVAYHQGDPRRATPIVIGQVGGRADIGRCSRAGRGCSGCRHSWLGAFDSFTDASV